MAAIPHRDVRSFVDNYGLAHTGNFDVRITGLKSPFDKLMPVIAMTVDREQLVDIESVPGLPAGSVRSYDGRNITMSMYDTVDRSMESQLREWMGEVSPKFRRAMPIDYQVRQITLTETVVQPTGTAGLETSLFSKQGLKAAASSVLQRAVRPVEDRVRLKLAQTAAELQSKFHTGWFNASIDDVFQIPTIRALLFEQALKSQQFKTVQRQNIYMVIPTGVVQTNADLSGKGGLATIDITLRIVGEVLTNRDPSTAPINPLEFAP